MNTTHSAQHHLHERLLHALQFIYAEIDEVNDYECIIVDLLRIMRIEAVTETPKRHKNLWTENDTLLITYGDSLLDGDEKPLKTLHRFLNGHCKDALSGVHILPFFPFSSDDGFSVIDFSSVNESLGDWEDISAIASDYKLMSDLVLNHCSARSRWFENFISGEGAGNDYFYTASPNDDLIKVVRPRTSPLLKEVETHDGTQHVWCTFSHDQVDLNFCNPEVLKQFSSIIRQYLDNGVRIFRLDAVAFLWKKPGTTCINLDETHEIIRLLRVLIEHAQPDAVIITETNIPNQENLTYFGNANEAHCVYNFSLPPLLVNTLITGNCHYLKHWMMSMPQAQNGTAYFNFIASHDGIGLRPAENLLSENEIDQLINTMQTFGGRVSWRTLESGKNKPYEINISLFDALQGTTKGPDRWNLERFICAHAIMFGLEGIPGIYVHSLLGTTNDYEKLKNTSRNRSINRHQWDYSSLLEKLHDEKSHHFRVFNRLKDLLNIRRQQAAFHPNATQFVLHLGDCFFGFLRQSLDGTQSIFCISNISDETQSLQLDEVNLMDESDCFDLISQASVSESLGTLTLLPYQSVWLSKHHPTTHTP